MGRFSRDENGTYIQRVRLGGRPARLELDCGYEGPEREAAHLVACVRIAERIHGRLGRMVEEAARRASTRCLPTVNRIREAEGKPPLSAGQFRAKMRLFDIGVSPDDGMITFTANAYEDEHNFVRVPFGPRGGLRDAYIE